MFSTRGASGLLTEAVAIELICHADKDSLRMWEFSKIDGATLICDDNTRPWPQEAPWQIRTNALTPELATQSSIQVMLWDVKTTTSVNAKGRISLEHLMTPFQKKNLSFVIITYFKPPLMALVPAEMYNQRGIASLHPTWYPMLPPLAHFFFPQDRLPEALKRVKVAAQTGGGQPYKVPNHL